MSDQGDIQERLEWAEDDIEWMDELPEPPEFTPEDDSKPDSA